MFLFIFYWNWIVYLRLNCICAMIMFLYGNEKWSFGVAVCDHIFVVIFVVPRWSYAFNEMIHNLIEWFSKHISKNDAHFCFAYIKLERNKLSENEMGVPKSVYPFVVCHSVQSVIFCTIDWTNSTIKLKKKRLICPLINNNNKHIPKYRQVVKNMGLYQAIDRSIDLKSQLHLLLYK